VGLEGVLALCVLACAGCCLATGGRALSAACQLIVATLHSNNSGHLFGGAVSWAGGSVFCMGCRGVAVVWLIGVVVGV
jgi:hypothetical protein